MGHDRWCEQAREIFTKSSESSELLPDIPVYFVSINHHPDELRLIMFVTERYLHTF